MSRSDRQPRSPRRGPLRSSGRGGPPRRPEGIAFAEWLLAQIGRIDQTPPTMAALQRGLDDAWDVLDQAADTKEARSDKDQH